MSATGSSSRPILQILGSANTRTFRCIWMLEELGRDYQHVVVQPWSRKLQPYNRLGKVPVLVERTGSEEFSLTESAAINTYLGEGTSLIPSLGRERARFDQFVQCLLTEVDTQGLWIHRKHEALGEYFGHVPEAVKEAKRCFDKVHDNVLIPQLEMTQQNTASQNYYLLGDTFTAADILFVHCLDWAKSIGWMDRMDSTSKHGVLMDYWDRCRARPAYRRTKAIQQAELDREAKRAKL